jgi:ATP-binding cassette, subfamily B, bacterial
MLRRETMPATSLHTASDRPASDRPASGGKLERRPLHFILQVVGGHKFAHAAILASVIFAVGCSVGSQYAVKSLVDLLARGHAAVGSGALWGAFALLAGLIAADNLSWRVGGWIAARSFVAVTGDIRRILFDHLLGHAPRYFADRQSGMLAGRVSTTGNAVFRIETMTTWNVLPPLLAVVGAIVMIASVDLPMGLCLVAVAAGLGAVLARMAQAGRKLHHDYAAAAATVDGQIVDVINNVSVVRAFGASIRERERFGADLSQEMDARRNSMRYLEKLRIFHAIVTAILTAALLGWTLWRWQLGRASPGDVVLVTSLGFTVLHGTRDLAVALVEMVQDWARLSDALASLLVPHDMPDHPEAKTLEVLRGAVTFSDVEFGYAADAPVLRDITLAIAPGERVGLVGRSGSGKTTLLALLQRQYDPAGGRVLIEGMDVASLSRDSIARSISIVSQDVQLFHRSVLENIRYGKPEASDAEVREAARAAQADGFIEGLAEGYETIVGERGMKLSGGQRQRIAIARAFLRDAPILLLDEATSALDSESEASVKVALDQLAAGRTVIAVAHRLSTLRDFDRIVVMDHGRIVDEGAPAMLARRPGPYRELLRHQNLHVVGEAVEAA